MLSKLKASLHCRNRPIAHSRVMSIFDSSSLLLSRRFLSWSRSQSRLLTVHQDSWFPSRLSGVGKPTSPSVMRIAGDRYFFTLLAIQKSSLCCRSPLEPRRKHFHSMSDVLGTITEQILTLYNSHHFIGDFVIRNPFNRMSSFSKSGFLCKGIFSIRWCLLDWNSIINQRAKGRKQLQSFNVISSRKPPLQTSSQRCLGNLYQSIKSL